ncbi:MAG: NUDIX domain-containing protein [Candidatus Microsaccharimonas sp.]
MDLKLHTPSAGGIVIRDGNVLLIYSTSRNSYAFPKGTIDEGETKDITAIREVKEETGYNVEILDFLGDYTFDFDWKDGNRYRKTVTYYLMNVADDEDPHPMLEEGEDFVNVWTPIDKAHEVLTFDDSKEILKLALKSSKFIH